METSKGRRLSRRRGERQEMTSQRHPHLCFALTFQLKRESNYCQCFLSDIVLTYQNMVLSQAFAQADLNVADKFKGHIFFTLPDKLEIKYKMPHCSHQMLYSNREGMSSPIKRTPVCLKFYLIQFNL